MEENLTYKDVPRNYTHCLNAGCERASECLRYQVTLLADGGVAYFLAVNPAYVAANQGECRYFSPIRTTRFAIGITHLFDNLPHKKAVRIKASLIKHFGRNHYYRIFRKEYFITSEEQDFIKQAFRDEGVAEEPAFDSYVDRYDLGSVVIPTP